MPPIKEALKMGSDMGKESGHQEKPNILVTMLKVSKKAMENFTFPVEISTKETLSTTREKAMDRCFGLTDLSIRETGRMECRTVRDRSILQEEKSSVDSSKTAS